MRSSGESQRADILTPRALPWERENILENYASYKKSGQQDSLWNKCQEGDELFSVQGCVIQRIRMKRSVFSCMRIKHTHVYTCAHIHSSCQREELSEPVPPGNCGCFSGLHCFPSGKCQECDLGRDVRFQMWPGLEALPEIPAPTLQ